MPAPFLTADYAVRLGPKGPWLGLMKRWSSRRERARPSSWEHLRGDEEITRDQVIVSPAPGEPERFPSGMGPDQGGPMIERSRDRRTPGQCLRSNHGCKRDLNFLLERFPIQISKISTDIAALIEEQLETTGTVPTHRRVVIDRFCDELGDDRSHSRAIWYRSNALGRWRQNPCSPISTGYHKWKHRAMTGISDPGERGNPLGR